MSDAETGAEDGHAPAAAEAAAESPLDALLPNEVLGEEDAEAMANAELADGVVDAGGVLAAVTAERDGYLDALQRLKAEFANHRRRTTEQAGQQRQQAAASLVEKLLPVLDSCDAAIAHGNDEVTPILDALVDVLAKDGLERIEPLETAFDPEFHDAVMHEASDDVTDVPMVTEVLRAGYAWNGRVLRPAMVKVRG